MGASRGRALSIFAPLVAAVVSPAFAQPPTAAGPPELMTLKERLGAKWTDEQRVDNCNVPLGKRGPVPRPDCSKRRSGSYSTGR